jgi:Holliday junction resolvase
MPINSRAKGARGEREFAALIDLHLGFSVRRNLEQSRSGGHDLVGLPGWAPEVKLRGSDPTPGELGSMWQQALRQAESVGARPVLALKVNRRGWRCFVDLADLRADLFERGQERAELRTFAFFQLVRGLLCD